MLSLILSAHPVHLPFLRCVHEQICTSYEFDVSAPVEKVVIPTIPGVTPRPPVIGKCVLLTRDHYQVTDYASML